MDVKLCCLIHGYRRWFKDIWLNVIAVTYVVTVESASFCQWSDFDDTLLRGWLSAHHHRHSWHASLGVRSAKCRHQSPEWTILSHISCFIEEEVVGFRVLLNSLRLHSTRASWWSSPILQGEAIKMILASVSSGIRTLCPNREKLMFQTSVVGEYWGWVL